MFLETQVGFPLKEIMFFNIIWLFNCLIIFYMQLHWFQSTFNKTCSCFLPLVVWWVRGGVGWIQCRIGKTAWKLQLGTTSVFQYCEPWNLLVSPTIHGTIHWFAAGNTNCRVEHVEHKCRLGFWGISSTTSWHVHVLFLYGTTFCWSDPHPHSSLPEMYISLNLSRPVDRWPVLSSASTNRSFATWRIIPGLVSA